MEVKVEFAKVMNSMKATIDNFPWENKQAYAGWVAQTYYFVLHSTRLFACAAGRCRISENTLHHRLLQHMAEEKGHENLATSDLKFLGVDVASVKELPETASMYQNQYFWIEHVSVPSFFGYLMCLEGLAVEVGAKVHTRVVDAHGQRACSFLKVHIGEDEGHLEEVFEQLKAFTDDDIENILINLRQSASLYLNMLNRIHSQVMEPQKKQAA